MAKSCQVLYDVISAIKYEDDCGIFHEIKCFLMPISDNMDIPFLTHSRQSSPAVTHHTTCFLFLIILIH